MRTSSTASVLALALCFAQGVLAAACQPLKQVMEATFEQVRAFFDLKRMKVVTFLGYSGAEYEDPAAMLKHAGRVLDGPDRRRAAVNIGATAQGESASPDTLA